MVAAPSFGGGVSRARVLSVPLLVRGCVATSRHPSSRQLLQRVESSSPYRPAVRRIDLHCLGRTKGLSYGATAICKLGSPEVRYQQGSADLCAAYGLASALQYRGDAEAASAIALCARGALASRDAFGHVRDVINSAAVEGWAVLTLKGHNPLSTIIADPINLRRRLELYCTKSLLRNHAVRKRVL